MVYLQTRKIEPLNVKRFFGIFEIEADGNVADRLIEMNNPWIVISLLGESLTGDETDTEVALLFLEEMETAYDVLVERLSEPFGALATDLDGEAELVLPEGAGAIARQLAPAVTKVRRMEQAAETQRDMVVTALRLMDNPDAPIPVDAFSPEGEPLLVIHGDEAIEVRSRHKIRDDQPHAFRIEK